MVGKVLAAASASELLNRQHATVLALLAVVGWTSQAERVTVLHAFTLVLGTRQGKLRWRVNFIAAFDTPMGTLRAEAILGGGRLAVGPVDTEATLAGAGPLGLVHIHAQICALHFIIFPYSRRGDFRCCCAPITSRRHHLLTANGDNRDRHHAKRHRQQGHHVKFHVNAPIWNNTYEASPLI